MSAYASFKSFFFLTFFIASLRGSTQLQDPTYVGHVCSNRVSRNSTYFTNLQTLLSSLSSNNVYFSLGSHSLAKGQNSEMVFGLYLCRGDLSEDLCRECVNFATEDTRSRCPGGKEFLIQYDECMLGYSDRNIFMDTVSTTRIITWNTQNVTSDQADRFNDAVFSLLKKSAEEAANSRSKKFAVKKSAFTSSQTLYASVQCIPDLPDEDCLRCLQGSISSLYFSTIGGRVLVPSCNSRYEIYPFYKETTPVTLVPPPNSASPWPPRKKKSLKVKIIASVVPAIFVLLFVAVLYFYISKKAKKSYETEVAYDGKDSKIYGYAALKELNS